MIIVERYPLNAIRRNPPSLNVLTFHPLRLKTGIVIPTCAAPVSELLYLMALPGGSAPHVQQDKELLEASQHSSPFVYGIGWSSVLMSTNTSKGSSHWNKILPFPKHGLLTRSGLGFHKR